MQQLFLGGTRSGKSRLAEAAAAASKLAVIYIATAQLRDAAMRARAHTHRLRRPDAWELLEEPLALTATLRRCASPNTCLLVDCLTLWLSNQLEQQADKVDAEISALTRALPELEGDIIFVSGEVGLGVMPANALARVYADKLGELNQSIAQQCDRVTLAIAGLPQRLK